MTARRPSSPAPSAVRSTPSRAGRSKRSGGSSRCSASTGRRCSTAICCASCTTTSRETSGSWSGSMTEAGSEAAVGWVSGLVGYLLQPTCIGVQVNPFLAAEPDAVAVRDELVIVLGHSDHFRFVRRQSHAELGPTLVRQIGEDWVPRLVGAKNTQIRTRLVEPLFGLAVRDREALHLRLEGETHGARLRIRSPIGEPENTRTASHWCEDPWTTSVLQSSRSEIKQEKPAARTFITCIAQPDALCREIDDHVGRNVLGRTKLVEPVIATGRIDHMEPRSTRRSRDLGFQTRIAGSTGRDRASVDGKPTRDRTVVVRTSVALKPIAGGIKTDGRRWEVDERYVPFRCPDRQPAREADRHRQVGWSRAGKPGRGGGERRAGSRGHLRPLTASREHQGNQQNRGLPHDGETVGRQKR